VAEREEIAVGLAAGEPLRVIAARLGRPASTVSREVARNSNRKGVCRALVADGQAQWRARRPKTAKLAGNRVLRAWVQDKLEQHWSPEQISVMLKREFPDDAEMRVPHETIYQSIYVQGRGALRRELAACLRTGRALRKPRRKTGERRGRIPGMVMISEQPAEVGDRAVPGHWEGDLITGAGNKSAIGTLVERTTRFMMLLHLPDGHGPGPVAAAMTQAMGGLPDAIRRSLTWDQDREMAGHAQIAVSVDLDIYFCDPHSPWQRGSNENTNGLLRQYFPKGTNLAVHSREHLQAVADELNARPRKTLGWKTPPRPWTTSSPTPPERPWWRLAPPLSSPVAGCRAAYGAAPPASRLLRIACGDGLRPALTPETSAAPWRQQTTGQADGLPPASARHPATTPG
jgi:IS30 family transposase